LLDIVGPSHVVVPLENNDLKYKETLGIPLVRDHLGFSLSATFSTNPISKHGSGRHIIGLQKGRRLAVTSAPAIGHCWQFPHSNVLQDFGEYGLQRPHNKVEERGVLPSSLSLWGTASFCPHLGVSVGGGLPLDLSSSPGFILGGNTIEL
jgi:hypothetical protein